MKYNRNNKSLVLTKPCAPHEILAYNEILSKRATAWQARNAWSREKRRENARLFPGSRAAILSGTRIVADTERKMLEICCQSGRGEGKDRRVKVEGRGMQWFFFARRWQKLWNTQVMTAFLDSPRGLGEDSIVKGAFHMRVASLGHLVVEFVETRSVLRSLCDC